MKKSAKELVNEITDFVNSMSLNEKEFIEAMECEHRTLQQSFTRLCFKWIEHCATDEYRHDGRNQATHETCKSIVQTYKKEQNKKWETDNFDFNLSATLSLI